MTRTTQKLEKGLPADPVLALRARELLARVRALVQAGKWKDAAPLCHDLVRTAPTLGEGHELMGIVAMKTGAVEIAAGCFERAVGAGPASGQRLLLWGQALLALGTADKAEQVLLRALAIRPDDPGVLRCLAQAQLDLGRPDAALKSFRRALKRRPDDAYSSHMVAALTRSGTPDRTYVAGLFDAYAGTFEEHLTGALQYRTPQLLADLLRERGIPRGPALDIGCGTGLMAATLAGDVEVIDGIDIAPAMIEKARARGLYRSLAAGDAIEVLAGDPDFAGPYALVLAADVFVYIGAIDALFAAIAARLAPAGLLAFSVETATGPGIEIRSSGRFAHGRAYLENLAAANGLAIAAVSEQPLRLELHRQVPGTLYVLGRR